MTQLQLYRKVKSLAWRRNIAGSLEKLESEIKAYMLETGSSEIVIAGHSVKLNNGNVVLEKLPVINLKQMELSFQEKKGEACAFQREDAERLGGFRSCISQKQNLHAQKN